MVDICVVFGIIYECSTEIIRIITRHLVLNSPRPWILTRIVMNFHTSLPQKSDYEKNRSDFSKKSVVLSLERRRLYEFFVNSQRKGLFLNLVKGLKNPNHVGRTSVARLEEGEEQSSS